jgi:hypothetical protein
MDSRGLTQIRTNQEERQNRQAPGDSLQDLIGAWVVQTNEADEETTTQYTAALEELAREAISWSTDEEWVVELQHPLPQSMRVWTMEDTEFWPTYMWTDNPGVTDHSGGMLTSRKYDRIFPCTIAELNVQRTGVRTYAMTIPFTNIAKRSSASGLSRFSVGPLGWESGQNCRPERR